MFSSRFYFDACRECTDYWNSRNGRPPCLRVMGMGSQGLIAVKVGEIGGSASCCPCIISYTELKTYASGGAGGVRMSTEAQTLLKVVQTRMKADTQRRWVNDPTYVGFMENGTYHNNYRGNLIVEPPDVQPQMAGRWVFVRRLSDPELVQLNEFRAQNAMDADWDDWESKYEAVWAMAKPLIMQKGVGQLTAMFSDPVQCSVAIGSIAVMFGPQGALLGTYRAILSAVGLGASAYQLAGLFKDFAVGTYQARKPAELKSAAAKLAEFLAMIATTGFFFILGAGVGKWMKAKAEAESGAPPEDAIASQQSLKPGHENPPGNLADYKPNPNWREELPDRMTDSVETISKQAGVQPFHIGDWSRLCRENGWLAVIRTGKVRGLRLHFDEMTAAAKSVLVKWKTDAKDGMIHRSADTDIAAIYEKDLPMQYAFRNGLKVPHTAEELAAFKQTYKQQLDAWKDSNKLAWIRNPEGPGEVLTHNGRIICSDYDKMGIYEMAGGKWQPQQRWYQFNDDPKLQSYINRYVRGSTMDQHGCQDFSGGPGGKPVRQPSPDEKFLVFEPPDGRPRIIESVGELKALYQRYGLRWPYDN